jgi:hypothetical protein
MTTRVYLELGKKRVVACALDWPGWCRIGKSEEEALAALDAYRPRYAVVAELAGLALPPAGDPFEVTERLATRSGAADFGVPGAVATSDVRPIDAAEAGRLAALVRAAWTAFDQVVSRSPEELRKGPRGGGRDRTKMVEHVLGGETGYVRKMGIKLPQPAVDDVRAIAAARAAIAAELERPSDGGPPVPNGWPPRYAARRVAWHVLDHAWEMEDRSTPEA